MTQSPACGPRRPLPLSGRAVSIDRLSDHLNQPPSAHDRLSIWLLSDPTAFQVVSVVAGQQIRTEGKGPASVVIPPKIAHSIHAAPRSEGFVFGVDAELVGQIVDCPPQETVITALPVLACRDALILGTVADLRQLERKSAFRVPLCVECAATFLAQHILEALFTNEHPPKLDGRFPPHIEQRFIALIHDHLHDGYSTELLCTALNYPRDRLVSECRATYGITPSEFYRRCRIERAAKLLLSTRRTQADIAATCGFGDEGSLIRNFLRYRGVTPSEIRKRAKN